MYQKRPRTCATAMDRLFVSALMAKIKAQRTRAKRTEDIAGRAKPSLPGSPASRFALAKQTADLVRLKTYKSFNTNLFDP